MPEISKKPDFLWTLVRGQRMEYCWRIDVVNSLQQEVPALNQAAKGDLPTVFIVPQRLAFFFHVSLFHMLPKIIASFVIVLG